MDPTDLSSTFSSKLIIPETGKDRNWAELPFDTLSLIYQKLGAVEVLMSAQAVCRLWRRLSFDPSLWRCIHLQFPHYNHFKGINKTFIACKAIDRSGGNVEELCIENLDANVDGLWIKNSEGRIIDCMSCNLLDFGDRTSKLRCLRLISPPVVTLIELVKLTEQCPLLEELEITKRYMDEYYYLDTGCGRIGRSCPELKRFRLNDTKDCGYDGFRFCPDNSVAMEIADNMRNLRELQLIGNNMNNKGLHAILDKCTHLETLDINKCLNIRFTKRIREKLAKLKTVLPSEDELMPEVECEDEWEPQWGRADEPAVECEDTSCWEAEDCGDRYLVYNDDSDVHSEYCIDD